MAKVLFPNSGQGGELRELLMRELGIPESSQAFTVSFAIGEPIRVSCEYLPTEIDDGQEQEDEPAADHRGLNG